MTGGGRVRHTTCQHCGMDIEGYLYGYGANLRIGKEWRDRGNNTLCVPDDPTERHEPVIDPMDRFRQTPERKKPKIRKVLSRPYQPSFYESQAKKCVGHLQEALTHARIAGAPYTVKRIEAALSSARGAVRNAGYRVTRAERE